MFKSIVPVVPRLVPTVGVNGAYLVENAESAANVDRVTQPVSYSAADAFANTSPEPPPDGITIDPASDVSAHRIVVFAGAVPCTAIP